ncbi:alternate-type signal peptide domain-containing protein [Georgenia thermotolerans]|uniref:Alternate-type signal peptide domain-containing protein n=1 Tax=Georgenia thermotolerans TaxID=527326 RepID=A0A7J5UQE5_9MICO|nr:alternate-type signal peptide domain-containing protein [Georgenia thermotolerans]KAE8764183.1 alternate-type signal peptide domain-containing protein [Georgenia thermotolerans]
MSRTASAQPRSSSKKMRNGVIAGIAGIALLAGGGASFATWSADWTTSGTISAGSMSLQSSWKGSGELSHWKLNDKAVRGVGSISELKLVPGDKLTYTDTVTLKTEKRAMSATVEPLAPGIVGDLQGVTYNVVVAGPGFKREWQTGQSEPQPITTRVGGDTELTVTTTFAFDRNAGNNTQNMSLEFTNAGIRVNQVAN